MQIRKLQRRSDTGTVSVWPPLVPSARGTFVRSGSGVLKQVTRADDHLMLTIEQSGRDAVGRLEWDPPPSLGAVERVLRAHLGELITAIGYLDVR